MASTSKEELFELLVESSTDFAIFTIDRNGTVTTWNLGAERLFGYSEPEILGRSGDVIFTPEDRAKGAAENERSRADADGRAADAAGTSEVTGRGFGRRAFSCRSSGKQGTSRSLVIELSSTRPKRVCDRRAAVPAASLQYSTTRISDAARWDQDLAEPAMDRVYWAWLRPKPRA